jgi:protein TonB
VNIQPTISQIALSIAVVIHATLFLVMPVATGEEVSIQKTRKIAMRFATAPDKHDQHMTQDEQAKPSNERISLYANEQVIKPVQKAEPKTEPKPTLPKELRPTPKPTPKPMLKDDSHPVLKQEPAQEVEQEQAVVKPPQPETRVNDREAITPSVSASMANSVTAPPSGLDDYLAQVRGLIESNKSYPFAARRRGMEGEVLLQVKIDENGKLVSLELLSSSGHDLLNRAAEKVVRTAAPFPVPESFWLGDVEFSIPIAYAIIK